MVAITSPQEFCHPRTPMIIWALGNLFTCRSGCQAPTDHHLKPSLPASSERASWPVLLLSDTIPHLHSSPCTLPDPCGASHVPCLTHGTSHAPNPFSWAASLSHPLTPSPTQQKPLTSLLVWNLQSRPLILGVGSWKEVALPKLWESVKISNQDCRDCDH